MMRADVKRLSEAEAINLDRCYAASDRQLAANRRQQALLAAAAEDGTGRRWAIARVAHKRENDVDKSLSAALIDHWLPLCKADQVQHGGRAGSKKDAFWVVAWPGYIFVRIADDPRAWAGLASIKHVVSVLGVDGSPFFTGDDMILKIKAELATLKALRKNAGTQFAEGDVVLVTDGPFASFPGRVDAIGEGSHSDRARVEVMIFGRSVPVELDLAQLAKGE
jgi:transcriptional antiterminator NusG